MFIIKCIIKILTVAILVFTMVPVSIVKADELEDARTSASYGSFNVLKDRLDYGDQKVVDIHRNAKHYGAIGDGVANDTGAIQAAIDSLNGGRGVVFLPAGQYYCANSIDAKRVVICGVSPPGKSGSGGTRILFTTGTGGIYSSIPDNFGYEVRDLEIFGSNGGTPTVTGQVLIDFSGQNYPRLFNLRLWKGDIGIRLKTDSGIGCYYGLFNRVDINKCNVGVKINSTSNSHTFIGGRIWRCKTGMLIANANNINLFGVYFERSANCAVDSTGHNVTISGCRFENPNITKANIYVHSDAGPHFLLGNHFSSGADILDETMPSVIHGIDRPDTPLTSSFAGHNLLVNGSFDYDLDSDGLANGWRDGSSNGGTSSLSLDPAEAQDGNYAQKMSNTDTNNLRIYQVVEVSPNYNYTLRIRIKASAGTNYLRIGNASWSADHSYKNVVLTADNTWHTYKYTICPTTSNINICIYLYGDTARNVWIDDVVLNPGIFTASAFLPKSVTEDGGNVFGDVRIGGNFGFHGAEPVSQCQAITDADGSLSDLTEKFNTLLDYLKRRGDISSGN